MRRVYPVILSPDDFGYLVTIPDFDINTEGHDLSEAIFMARDAIGAVAICMLDDGREVPEPSVTEPPHKKSDLVSWIDIDFDEYREATDTTAERTSVSLPRNLKRKAEAAGISFSRELQIRLKELLHV